MNLIRTLSLATLLSLAVIIPSYAHSVRDVEQNLYEEEKFFQPVNEPASGFALEGAQGNKVDLDDFRGKVVVLHFIYTNCSDVCPLHAQKIAQIQQMANGSPMKDRIQFVTITTDPTFDKGDVLTEYGDLHGLDPVNWTFLTSSPDEAEDTTRRLAASYGLEFTETEDGAQMHGVVTFVIDQEGQLRARFHGLRFDPLNLVVYVNALTNKDLAPHDHPGGVWGWVQGVFGR